MGTCVTPWSRVTQVGVESPRVRPGVSRSPSGGPSRSTGVKGCIHQKVHPVYFKVRICNMLSVTLNPTCLQLREAFLFRDQDRVHVFPMGEISLLHRLFGIESGPNSPDPFDSLPESPNALWSRNSVPTHLLWCIHMTFFARFANISIIWIYVNKTIVLNAGPLIGPIWVHKVQHNNNIPDLDHFASLTFGLILIFTHI